MLPHLWQAGLDWCRVSKDGKYALCSRIPVYGQQGSLHKIDENIETNGLLDKSNYYPPINWFVLNKFYVANCPLWRINQFGALKGITPRSLIRLNIGFDGEAYTFAIQNENYIIVGIQRQFPDGAKTMVRGSKLGLFIPTVFRANESNVFITEGVSDTAIALDLDLNVIGRLNCSSGTEVIKKIMNKHYSNAYIIIDNDSNRAGYDGGMKLANELKAICKTVKVIIPPAENNDLRGWVTKGGLDAEGFNKIVMRLPIL